MQPIGDAFVPMEFAEVLRLRIRGSRLVVIPSRGHLPHVSAPAVVIAEMRAFPAR